MCFAPQRRAPFRHLNLQKWSENGVLCTSWVRNLLRATTACFFDIATSKSGPTMVCFVHFDFDMCFAPQRRAFFRHLKCQKSSAPLVFLTCWLGNVLHAKTACTFSTSQLPKVVRSSGVLCILIWKCASRATMACNFSSLLWPAGSAPAALASLLFDPPDIGKTQCFATFLPFRASPSSFFLLFLFYSSLCLCSRKFDF